MNRDRPLDGVGSIKLKLGALVGASIVAALVVVSAGSGAGVPWWTSVPVTLGAAVGVTLWLARGMTSPLREMTAAARRMAAGDYGQRVTATSTDEVGELARAFNAMASDLSGADLERRRLVATVSHELRTPLTAQRALLENLADGVVTPDADTLRSALVQAERLSTLVGDLLDLSRIDAGVAPLALAPVRVDDLLAAATDEAAVGARPVRVSRSVDPADLSVTADAARLAQLVHNLVDNAVRHSPTGGEVRIRAHRDGERWVLDVHDDGPGISAGEAGRVFERFGTGADSGGGTGLGLAIVRWVCELHGGLVEVLPTAPGRLGAHLRVVLPVHPDPTRPTHLREESRMSPVTTPDTAGTPGPSTPTATTAATSGTVVTPYGGSGGPADPLVARLWPESDGGPRIAVVAAALGVGLLAALTWVERSIGLATSLVMLAAGALMWAVARHRGSRFTLVCGALAALLVTIATLRDAGGVVVLSVLAGVVVAAVGLTRAHGLAAMLASGLAWPLSALRGLPLLGRTLSATSRVGVLWPAVRTGAVTLVLVAVFGGLFASGDAVFGSWAQALVPDLGWDAIVARIFTFVLVSGVVLTGAYLALNPPNVDTLAPARSRRARPVWEWAVPVGGVVLLFAAFLLAQATVLFGGDDYLRRTTGLTHAEYVHQGFGQMTAATFLTVLVMAVTLRVAGREDARERLVTRALLGALGVFTLAVVGSALYRMSLYQDAFGFTTLRVWVDGFELWLGLVVVMLLVGVVLLRVDWVPRAVLVSGALFTLGFAALNPDGWVAGQNIDRYEATGEIDALYLASLSADATPVIAERLPAQMASCVLDGLSEDLLAGDGADDPLEFNLGRWRAERAVAGLPALQSQGREVPAVCRPYQSDSYTG